MGRVSLSPEGRPGEAGAQLCPQAGSSPPKRKADWHWLFTKLWPMNEAVLEEGASRTIQFQVFWLQSHIVPLLHHGGLASCWGAQDILVHLTSERAQGAGSCCRLGRHCFSSSPNLLPHRPGASLPTAFLRRLDTLGRACPCLPGWQARGRVAGSWLQAGRRSLGWGGNPLTCKHRAARRISRHGLGNAGRHPRMKTEAVCTGSRPGPTSYCCRARALA